MIERVEVGAFTIPTEAPESDGTLAWEATTLVVVEIHAGGQHGFGYTYAHAAVARVIADTLAKEVRGHDPMAVGAAWERMVRAVRNQGVGGVCAMAISAVDTALWDLKARLLGVPLVSLLGPVRASVPVYGSGGFTSSSTAQLCAQLSGWAKSGIRRVKMKVGRAPPDDLARVEAARKAIGDRVELFVDANGAYSRQQALRFAEGFAALDVRWFEEPVPSDDVEGLSFLRERAPPGMDISAGEYGYTAEDFRRLLGAVDVLQPDVTRCLGLTGLLRVAALCHAHRVPLSTHCAPALHLHAACALPELVHVEWFFDHVRIEQLLFDGAPQLVEGSLRPDLSRPGIGLEFKRADARRYAV